MPSDIINIINPETAEIIKWAAVCSSTELLVTELKDETDKLLKYIEEVITPDNSQNISNTIVLYIKSIFINRKYDIEFIDMLMDTGNKELMIGSIDTLVDVGGAIGNINPEKYFERYISSYGEDNNILMLMLKWYMMPTNYSKNIDKVNSILAKVK